MVLPLFGFLFSAALFAAVGLLVFRFSGIRPIRLALLATFVVTAQVGLLAYAAAYGALFANAANHLASTGAVIGLLVGMPVAGTLAGWLVTRSVARRMRPGAVP